jgi:hypoxanthine-DNA glycosylase
MIEKNPFRYFIPEKPHILIVGSFPCFNGVDYGNWYYSGSGKNYFWKLLGEVFGMPAETRVQKEKLCEKHGIALTDIAYKIERLSGNCSDINLRILEFNDKGIDKCLKSGINKILFTSSFVQRHFLRLHPHLQIPCYNLLSPSPAANRHIGGLPDYKHLVKNKKIISPYDYRLLKYREILNAK